MNTDEIMKLTDTIRETGFSIHNYHGYGYLEKVYENTYVHRLRKLGLDVKQQHAIHIKDEDGVIVGEYFADLLIENEIIVELKAVKNIADEHRAQLINYLKGSGIQHGLLINFGAKKFFIQKFIKSSPPPMVTKLKSILLPLCGIFSCITG